MAITPSENDIVTSKYSTSLFLVLTVAGLAGNYFSVPIFLNMYFLFGSIFAMLALQFFGSGRGVIAAAVIAGSTCFLWNHPYAIITMTAEVAVVGWLMRHRKMGMVVADTLYWLIIGMPLVYLFYHLVMHVPSSDTYIVMTKHSVNGIFNTLIAHLIFIVYTVRTKSSQTSYREIIYSLLGFFVLFPVLIMLALGSRTDFSETDKHIRAVLINASKRQNQFLDTWVKNRKRVIVNLAEMAASRSSQQMQIFLEQTNKSDVNFLRIGLLDREATVTAYFPLIDELGQHNIGKNFADRPYVPVLKQTLKPLLSEVVIGRIGVPKPTVMILAPVISHGEYGGYVAGILSLEQIQEHLEEDFTENTTFYTLVDKNGNVIMTNRADQKVMSPFMRGKGSLNRLDSSISQWVPPRDPNTPVMETWGKILYVAESSIGDLAEWRLIQEQPVAPFQKQLYASYAGKLTLLFVILLGALALAEFLSRKIVITLKKLNTITQELPVRLATDGNDIVWPESAIQEACNLIGNFREMSDSLSGQFAEIQQINASLEQRVEERTGELNSVNTQLAADITKRKLSEEALAKTYAETVAILQCAAEGIMGLDADGNHTFVNTAAAGMLGYKSEELLGKNSHNIWHYKHADGSPYPVGDCPLHATLHEGNPSVGEDSFFRKDGTYFIAEFSSMPLFTDSRITGAVFSFSDISDRKRAEEEKVKLENQLLQAQKMESVGRLAGGVAHDFKELSSVTLNWCL
jgi:PAS domain S-box-containing protein